MLWNTNYVSECSKSFPWINHLNPQVFFQTEQTYIKVIIICLYFRDQIAMSHIFKCFNVPTGALEVSFNYHLKVACWQD